MKILKFSPSFFFVIAFAAATMGATPSRADDHYDHHWHGGFHHFRDHRRHDWGEGRWFHGDHDRRHGWWWIVGGVWYFYPRPVYPYPMQAAPPIVVSPPAHAYWYYCPAPPGYYPYVPRCTTRWIPVHPSPR